METYYGTYNQRGSYPFSSKMNPRMLFYKYEYRAPKKGEHFLSGNKPTIYLSNHDMTMNYWIMKPFTKEVEQRRKDSFLAKVSEAVSSECTKNNLGKAEAVSYMKNLTEMMAKL